jgi:hypothetical protein
MSDAGITIDLGSALPWVEDRIRRLLGKDETTAQQKALLKQLHDTALEMTRSVQCIGMHKPVAFEDIYQPTKIRIRSGLDISTAAAFRGQNRIAQSIAVSRGESMSSASIDEFIESPENATVFAGPGWGKTTFIHHIFRRSASDALIYPVLITLRRPTALEDLEAFVNICQNTSTLNLKRFSKVLLLVDGYDEISLQNRKKVSEALLRFSATKIGRFILTCRDHYAIVGLNTSHVHIDCFDKHDKYRFVTAFLKAFKSRLDPIRMVNELEDRELSDFLSHPLLLALACIVKCGKNSQQPRSALRLLERALMTLQYTWDMDKGIERERLTELDGGDRIDILKHIAFASRSPFMQGPRAEMIARKALDSMQVGKIDPVLVLRETAQFYGILVQSSEGWEFVHRSIQDYLAAKHWVETGNFANERRYQWNTRTAYAACISGNAAAVLTGALASPDGITCAAETLMNAPSFNMKVVSEALANYYSARGRIIVIQVWPDEGISGGIEVDLFRLLSNRFLNHLIEKFCKNRTSATDVLIGYCLSEMRRRRLRMDHSTYEAIRFAIPNPRFQFKLADGSFVTPEMAKPVKASTSPA